MINDVNNLLLRERGAVTKARPQQFYNIYIFHELSHDGTVSDATFSDSKYCD